jgi:hypothetical protein
MFVGKAMSIPKRCFTKIAPALLANIRLGWEDFLGTNISLLQTFVTYDRKKFCNIEPWCQCYKMLFEASATKLECLPFVNAFTLV